MPRINLDQNQMMRGMMRNLGGPAQPGQFNGLNRPAPVQYGNVGGYEAPSQNPAGPNSNIPDIMQQTMQQGYIPGGNGARIQQPQQDMGLGAMQRENLGAVQQGRRPPTRGNRAGGAAQPQQQPMAPMQQQPQMLRSMLAQEGQYQPYNVQPQQAQQGLAQLMPGQQAQQAQSQQFQRPQMMQAIQRQQNLTDAQRYMPQRPAQPMQYPNFDNAQPPYVPNQLPAQRMGAGLGAQQPNGPLTQGMQGFDWNNPQHWRSEWARQFGDYYNAPGLPLGAPNWTGAGGRPGVPLREPFQFQGPTQPQDGMHPREAGQAYPNFDWNNQQDWDAEYRRQLQGYQDPSNRFAHLPFAFFAPPRPNGAPQGQQQQEPQMPNELPGQRMGAGSGDLGNQGNQGQEGVLNDLAQQQMQSMQQQPQDNQQDRINRRNQAMMQAYWARKAELGRQNQGQNPQDLQIPDQLPPTRMGSGNGDVVNQQGQGAQQDVDQFAYDENGVHQGQNGANVYNIPARNNRTATDNFLNGTDPYAAQIPVVSQNQQDIMHDLLTKVGRRVDENRYDFEPIAAKHRDDFQRNVLPSLANRFSAFGGGLSTDAYQNAMARAHSDSELGISALRSQYNLQKNSQDQGLLNTLLQPQFNTLYTPGTPGFLQQMVNAGGATLPGFVGELTRGYMNARNNRQQQGQNGGGTNNQQQTNGNDQQNNNTQQQAAQAVGQVAGAAAPGVVGAVTGAGTAGATGTAAAGVGAGTGAAGTTAAVQGMAAAGMTVGQIVAATALPIALVAGALGYDAIQNSNIMEDRYGRPLSAMQAWHERQRLGKMAIDRMAPGREKQTAEADHDAQRRQFRDMGVSQFTRYLESPAYRNRRAALQAQFAPGRQVGLRNQGRR